MGLTGDELREALAGEDAATLESHIRSMLDEYLIIRTGVINVRFVATANAKPWILHSFKILRTKVSRGRFLKQDSLPELNKPDLS
jgi:hypothetical protein